MRLVKTVLVAVNFDDTLDAVLAAASALPKKFGSEIFLAHVVEADDEPGQVPESPRTSIPARTMGATGDGLGTGPAPLLPSTRAVSVGHGDEYDLRASAGCRGTSRTHGAARQQAVVRAAGGSADRAGVRRPGVALDSGLQQWSSNP